MNFLCSRFESFLNDFNRCLKGWFNLFWLNLGLVDFYNQSLGKIKIEIKCDTVLWHSFNMYLLIYIFACYILYLFSNTPVASIYTLIGYNFDQNQMCVILFVYVHWKNLMLDIFYVAIKNITGHLKLNWISRLVFRNYWKIRNKLFT